MAREEINLLKGMSNANEKLAAIEHLLTKITWWALGGLFSIAIITGSLYFFASSKKKELEVIQVELLTGIKEETPKEGILVSLKQRSAIAGKALEAAKPYGKLFSLLETLAPIEYYTNLSIDEQARSTVSLVLPSIDEAIVIIANVLVQAEEKQVRNPQMTSFYLMESGLVQLSLSFIASL